MRLTVFATLGILCGAVFAYAANNFHETHYLHRKMAAVKPAPAPAPMPQPEMLPVVKIAKVKPMELSDSTIEVFTDEMEFQVGHDLDQPETKCFRIENTGSGRVQWTVSATDSNIKMHPVSGILDAGKGQWVTVTVGNVENMDESIVIMASPSLQSPQTIRIKVRNPEVY